MSEVSPSSSENDHPELEDRVLELELEVQDLKGLLRGAIAGGQLLLEWLQAMEVDRLAIMAAWSRRGASSEDYIRRLVALDPRLLDASALNRLGTRGRTRARPLDRWAELCRVWRDAWVKVVAAHLDPGLLPAAGGGAATNKEWIRNRELLTTMTGLASPELVRDCVEILEGMAAYLSENGSEPEHKEWETALTEWATFFRRVNMAGPSGTLRTWPEFMFHPDYVDVCSRTTCLEFAAAIVTALAGMVEYFSTAAEEEEAS